MSSFFKEQKEQSGIKSEIVTAYFDVWARIMINNQKRHQIEPKIGYIDFFAGPGRYDDGTISTPIKILELALSDDVLKKSLVTIFNDKDINNTSSLENVIRELPNITELKYTPLVQNEEITESIVDYLNSQNFIPTLFFVDPWGYKGLSLDLISSIIKDFGCDLIFFFNYNRVSMGINNDLVKRHMSSLFGNNTLRQLKSELCSCSNSSEKEKIIIKYLCEALTNGDAKYVLPFRFKASSQNRTSHHIIFVTKHFKGYEVMKEIMAKHSSPSNLDIPSFEYSPYKNFIQQALMFESENGLKILEDDLLETFEGQYLEMKSIYRIHSVGTPYIKKHYKDALFNLYKSGKIGAVTANGKNPSKNKRAFADKTYANFRI